MYSNFDSSQSSASSLSGSDDEPLDLVSFVSKVRLLIEYDRT